MKIIFTILLFVTLLIAGIAGASFGVMLLIGAANVVGYAEGTLSRGD